MNIIKTKSKIYLKQFKNKFKEIKKNQKYNLIKISFKEFNIINNEEILLFEILLKTYQKNKNNLNYNMINNIESILTSTNSI